jgi:hypothetical protein
VFLLDASSGLSAEQFHMEQAFVANTLFTSEWNYWERLAIGAYSDLPHGYSQYGDIQSLDEAKNLVNSYEQGGTASIYK